VHTVAGPQQLLLVPVEPGRRGRRGTRSERRWALAFFVVVVLFGLGYVAFALTRSSSVVVHPGSSVTGSLPRSRIDLYMTPVAIDPENSQIEFDVYPVFLGSIGGQLGTAARASVPLTLYVDGSATPEQTLHKGELLGRFGIKIVLREATGLSSFPFDSYRAQLVASARQARSSAPIPVVIYAQPPGVAGYIATFQRAPGFAPQAGLSSGNWRTAVAVRRDMDVKAVTFLVAFVMIFSGLAVLSVGFTIIVGRRKAQTGDSLAWLALFPFALIVLRDVIPVAPPVGVDFDVIAYYWPVAIGFLIFIGCVIRWLATPGAD
jgi:hypothetical protein